MTVHYPAKGLSLAGSGVYGMLQRRRGKAGQPLQLPLLRLVRASRMAPDLFLHGIVGAGSGLHQCQAWRGPTVLLW